MIIIKVYFIKYNFRTYEIKKNDIILFNRYFLFIKWWAWPVNGTCTIIKNNYLLENLTLIFPK